MTKVRELPKTSKENDFCPFCSVGILRIREVPPRVYLECDQHPLHYRLATEEEIASLTKGH